MSAIVSTPWPLAFPHIVKLDDGRIVELCCPHCKGNARSRSPNGFLDGAQGLLNHVARIHKEASSVNNLKQLLSPENLRVLTAEEVTQIGGGNYSAIIVKRKVAKQGKKDSKLVTQNPVVPIAHYPMIALDKEGNYVQLACKVCNGNAQTKTGAKGRTSATGGTKLEFFSGVRAIVLHIGQAHDVKASHDWVLENCGTILDDQTVALLKADVACGLIQKVKAESKPDPSKSFRRKKKGDDSLGTAEAVEKEDDTDVADGDFDGVEEEEEQRVKQITYDNPYAANLYAAYAAYAVEGKVVKGASSTVGSTVATTRTTSNAVDEFLRQFHEDGE